MQRMREVMQEQGLTPHTLEDRLNNMSAHQFFGEISPSLEADMGGIAAEPGPGKIEIMQSTDRGLHLDLMGNAGARAQIIRRVRNDETNLKAVRHPSPSRHAQPADTPLRHHRDRQRKLALQEPRITARPPLAARQDRLCSATWGSAPPVSAPSKGSFLAAKRGSHLDAMKWRHLLSRSAQRGIAD
jgi:hypothetical protein